MQFIKNCIFLVEKSNIVAEHMQKPSQLKAKFESLAMQNDAKVVEKKKPAAVQVKRIFPVYIFKLLPHTADTLGVF